MYNSQRMDDGREDWEIDLGERLLAGGVSEIKWLMGLEKKKIRWLETDRRGGWLVG